MAPIKPPDSGIILAGYGLFVDEIETTFLSEFFDRAEFDHERQRQAKEQTGVIAQFVPMFAGQVAQIGYTCAPVTPRPVTPIDGDIINIKKRFDIQRWTMKGLPSNYNNTQALLQVAATHRKFLDIFNYRQNLTGQSDISIALLQQFQTDVFTYLTNTGVFMTGAAVGTIPNVLL